LVARLQSANDRLAALKAELAKEMRQLHVAHKGCGGVAKVLYVAGYTVTRYGEDGGANTRGGLSSSSCYPLSHSINATRGGLCVVMQQQRQL
jgi:hypothetical protein